MLAPWVLSFFPPHRVYVEPFGGAASVLLRKPRSKVEIYNDLDDQVVNVFRVMQDSRTAGELAALLQVTPFARQEYNLSFEPCSSPVERARRTIIRSFMGHAGDSLHAVSKSGFRSRSLNADTHRNGALDWANYPAHIASFVERLQGVIIEQKKALAVLEVYDAEDTLFYVDPPYLLGARGGSEREKQRRRQRYDFEMSDEEHVELCRHLAGLKGMVILSGYPNSIYDLELGAGWETRSAGAFADGGRGRTEMLWINEAVVANQRRQVEMPI
jgi:DNA adenine methylase